MLLWCQTLLYYYISVRSHDRYNSFFSAFHSKQINIKIYSYLNVFDNNNSAPSLHEQLPAIVTRSGFGWISFLTHRLAVYKRKQFKFIVINALLSARSIPYVNHTSCVDSIHINQSKNWIHRFSQRSSFGDHTADKEPKWPWARDCGMMGWPWAQMKA